MALRHCDILFPVRWPCPHYLAFLRHDSLDRYLLGIVRSPGTQIHAVSIEQAAKQVKIGQAYTET